ncbi:MAG: hypothetical protein WKF59_26675 [Chitinophagaceae bacterium]
MWFGNSLVIKQAKQKNYSNNTAAKDHLQKKESLLSQPLLTPDDRVMILKKIILKLPRMKFYRKYRYLRLLPLLVFFQCCSQVNNSKAERNPSDSTRYYTVDDFKSVEKIDAHVHIITEADTVFIKQAEEDNFRLLTINVYKDSGTPIEEQQKFSIKTVKAFPGRISWATTFSLKNFNNDGWQQEVIEYLKNSFSNGAVAVKVWKNIGFFLKDKNGRSGYD